MEKIIDVAKKYGINELFNYGDYMAKVKPLDKFGKGKVILVTATTPTKLGEGKTTIVIGLSDALSRLGLKSVANLREPSMGPVFGIKGGATGGGNSIILPENDINLHFTGDFHAITYANNLICAVIDNEIFHDNKLDFKEVTFNRCLDINDRALRNVNLNNREEHFDITAASEIMACLCLAKNETDLRNRLNDIIVGYNSNLREIYLSSLGITDALMGILSNAILPNLVQTKENNLAIVHGGPFANIAHGCSSLISLEYATNVSDYIITEAGFGADAGAFKFIDILTRENKFNLHAIVLVTTIRSLYEMGNGILEDGVYNLKTHVNNLKLMNNNIIVTLNKFENDKEEDIKFISKFVNTLEIPFSINEVFKKGGEGAIDLANKIIKLNPFEKNRYIYDLNDSLYYKIDSYCKLICHTNGFTCSIDLMNKINELDKYKYPICIAKTQYSLNDNKKMLRNTDNYKMTLTDIKVKNGAKLIICYFGNILTMPGLSENPSVKEIKYIDNEVVLPR